MRSAAALILASLLALALFARLNKHEKPRSAPPQTPPSAAEARPSFTEDYEEAMKESERKVLLVFGAEWCPHCKTLEKHLMSASLDGVLVCEIDVDAHQDIARKHHVRGLPTSIMLSNREEISRTKGFSQDEYDAWLSEARQK